MIARVWRGHAEASKAEAYARHFTTSVAPHLKDIPGHRGAHLLRREAEGHVEFLALTLWDSIESTRSFPGPDPDRAVVESEARAVLSAYDHFVRHYEVAYGGA